MSENNIDEQTELYNKGVKTGIKHSVPSPITLSKFDELAKHNGEQDVKLGNIETTLGYINDGIKGINKKLDDMDDVKGDVKGLLVFKTVTILVITAVVGAASGMFGYLFINSNKHNVDGATLDARMTAVEETVSNYD